MIFYIIPNEFMQSIYKIQLSLNRNVLFIKGFFVLFYGVGVAGMLIPYTFPLFVKLIPFALLLTTGALAILHETFTRKQAVLFGIIFLAGYLVEAVGVQTGSIFGHYSYGHSLGLQLFNTPLIIGLNWLLLVYLTASVMEQNSIPSVGKVFLASLLMLGYDIILEQVAPVLDMWYWREGNVPLQNYLSWFIIALIFHALARAFKTDMKNKLGPFLFVCQTVFFILLLIFLI
ncbi:MAG: carotenoid biosynthesis protein [Mariniphaga sp.]